METTTEGFVSLFKGIVGNCKITDKMVLIDGEKRTKHDDFPDLVYSILLNQAPHTPTLAENITQLKTISRDISNTMLAEALDQDGAKERAAEDQDLEVVLDPVDSEFFVCNKSDGLYNPIGEAYLAKLPRKIKDLVKSEARYKVKVFDPRPDAPDVAKINTPSGIVTYPAVNTFIKPPFLFTENRRESLDQDHKDFLKIRFTHQKSLQIYLAALYHMITDRFRHCLFLVHPREGTGKTIAMGEIPAALVGNLQSASLRPEIIRSPFNGILEGKRHILLDEFRLSASHENLFKKMTEDPLFINAKNKQEKNIYNALSIFGTSNKYNIFTLPSNRRNIFLEDSGLHILEEKSMDWVSKYVHRLKNDLDFVANLGYYIINKFEGLDMDAAGLGKNLTYKGPTFERMVYETCGGGYKYTLQKLHEEDVEPGDEFFYVELRNDYNRKSKRGKDVSYFPSKESFKDFFKDYTEDGKTIVEIEDIPKSDDLILRKK